MRRQQYTIRTLATQLSIMIAASATAAWAAASKPNVIIVLIDDQGYGDLSCHGNPIVQTPQIDRLHGQSIRLTDFHVAPMCTPTRSQLMTGRDAFHNGAMKVSSGRTMMRTGLTTMPERFADSGYRTGLFGKWHLGDVYPHRPQDRGFERAIWFPSSHIPSAPDYWENDYFDPHLRDEQGNIRQYPGYCSDVFFNEAMSWIKARNDRKEPFFAYIPLNAAHGPWWVPDKYREPYRQLPAHLASYYGMIANIDENMGRLDAMLNAEDLLENTILIFATDNGGTLGVDTFNAGMKGGKITLWEGGHRVPCFIRWPAGRLGKPRDIDELTHVQDLFPTLIDLCGIESPPDPQFDGISLVNLLRDKQEHLPDRMLVVQFSRMDHQQPIKGNAAVLWKKWRLVDDKQLYDVSADLKQENNIADQHPDIVEKMRAHYEKWWTDIEPRVNEFTRITIGSTEEPLTLLSAADWQDVFLDQQAQVRNALNRSGPWGLNVARDGEYTFELRRWAREADLPLSAPAPHWKGVDGEMPAGKALPIARAMLKVGDHTSTAEVTPDDKFIRFTLPLQAGNTRAQTWFFDADDRKLCGAYYVYVHTAAGASVPSPWP